MHSRYYGIALAVVIAFSISSPALATVQGTVTDTDGNPVVGALVTFTDESNSENHYSTFTNAAGGYELFIEPVSVEDVVPSIFQLRQNYPNPFNPTTTIPFSLDNSGFIDLSIYNILGQKVRTLVNRQYTAGQHSIVWNGLDDNGASVGAGIYLCRLEFGKKADTRKMLLIDGGSNPVLAKNASTAITKGENVFTVTITSNDIETYVENGVSVIDGQTYDFVVKRLTQKIIDITPQQAKTLIEENYNNPDFVVIDVRSPEEYAEVHLENTVNIDFRSETFSDDIDKLDKNGAYLIYCLAGTRSAKARDIMKELGFTEVYNMLGGIYDWIASEYPTVQ